MRTVKLPSHWLRRICRLLLLCLAFQVVAVAAHTCPVQAEPATEASRSHCVDEALATSAATTDSALCAQHCAPERATGTAHADLQVPLAWLPELPPMAVADRQSRPPACRAIAAVAPPQPIRTRYCSLLI